MKRILLMAVTALLLLTQCRKQAEITPDSNTVTMTITAGPGRTDIGTAGGIIWSENDRIYVSDGNKYKGYLTIVDGVGFPTGTFTGTLTDVPDGEYNFQFFYLGQGNGVEPALNATSVNVSLATQEIIPSDGILINAMKYHVGHGESTATVTNHEVSKVGVELTSIVSVAYFKFQDEDENPYKGAITLSGEHVYNAMTLNANGTFTGTKGGISLPNTTSAEKYMMLIPSGTNSEKLVFTTTSLAGSVTFVRGIQGNKFYRMNDGSPILVNLKAATPPGGLDGEFTVDPDGNKVKFSQGNLLYLGQAPEGQKWCFSGHQYDILGDGPSSGTGSQGNVDLGSAYTGKYNTGSGVAGPNETDADKAAARDLFGWGCTGYQDTRKDGYTNWYQINYQPYSTSTSIVNTTYNYYGYGPDSYSETRYGLSVEHKSDWGCLNIYSGGTATNGWRTLTTDEWGYLIDTRKVTVSGAQKASYGHGTVNGVNGLIILPDNWDGSVCPGFTYGDSEWSNTFSESTSPTWSAMESAGAVFLPAAGIRNGSSVNNAGSRGFYWSSSYNNSRYAYSLYFYSDDVDPQDYYNRNYGQSVRLVCDYPNAYGEGDIYDFDPMTW